MGLSTGSRKYSLAKTLVLAVAAVVVPLGVLASIISFLSFAISSQLGDRLPDIQHKIGGKLSKRVPQWSPQADAIVFEHDQRLYRIGVDGFGLLPITGDPAEDEREVAISPDISPDGFRLAYASYKHDSWLPWKKHYQWQIVTSDLDGSDKRRLTKIKSDHFYPGSISPVWSPDGKRIAFLSDRLVPGRPDIVSYYGHFRIYTMASDGSDVRTLAPLVRVKANPPSWSPDGQYLAFEGFNPDLATGMALYTVRVDGSDLAKLGNTASPPTWSPDSSWIAFLRNDADGSSLHIISPNGSNATKIAQFSDDQSSRFRVLSWFPDGMRIFISGEGMVAAVDSDGSDYEVLIDTAANTPWLRAPFHISWSPDTSRVAIYAAIDDGYVANRFDMVLSTMVADGSNKRILARLQLYNDVVGAHGVPWPPEFEGGKQGGRIDQRSSEIEANPPVLADNPKAVAMIMAVPPPCTISPNMSCTPRDISRISFLTGTVGASSYGHDEASSVEDLLEKGLFLMEASPAHIAIRGTTQQDSVRCQWRGTARTIE